MMEEARTCWMSWRRLLTRPCSRNRTGNKIKKNWSSAQNSNKYLHTNTYTYILGLLGTYSLYSISIVIHYK